MQRHAVHDRRPCRARGRRSGSGGRRASSTAWTPAPLSSVPVLPVRSAPPPTRPGTTSAQRVEAPCRWRRGWRPSRRRLQRRAGRPPSPGRPLAGEAPRRARPGRRSRRRSALLPGLALGAATARRPPGRARATSSGTQNGSSGRPMTALVRGDRPRPEGVAVGGRVVGVVGRREADVAAQDDQRRAGPRRPWPGGARPRARRGRRRSRRGARRASRRPRSAWPASSVSASSVGPSIGDVVVVVDEDEAARGRGGRPATPPRG